MDGCMDHDYYYYDDDGWRQQNYRDLSKPVGALEAKRLSAYLDRYESFEDEVIPKFMYGSHYSTAGVVLHYLVRQEPFSTLAIRLQGGTFDCPNRLFFDIASTWEGCHHSMTDVKELVPELFSVPEVLINSNDYPLGELDDGKGTVGNVRLPPWAKNAYDFIRINRQALESEYVSKNLHHWIDLVFGYKQKGEEAVASHNVFYYLTYEGAIDIDAIQDKVLRDATESQASGWTDNMHYHYYYYYYYHYYYYYYILYVYLTPHIFSLQH